MFIHRLNSDTELRLLQPRHAEEIYSLVDVNREHLRKWLSWVDTTKSPADIRAFIKQQLHNMAENSTTIAGIWKNGTFVGTIGLHFVDNKCMEIGYWLGEEFQGQGTMTAACKAMITLAFAELEINRIEIRAEPTNERSKALPKRLGFTCEGKLRQRGIGGDGNAVDLMMYSLLKSEWDNPKQQNRTDNHNTL